MLATRSRSSSTQRTPLVIHDEVALPPPPQAFPVEAVERLRNDESRSAVAHAFADMSEYESESSLEDTRHSHLRTTTLNDQLMSQRHDPGWASFESLPPDYIEDTPPRYDPSAQHETLFPEDLSRTASQDKKAGLATPQGEPSHAHQTMNDEKRQLELDAIADALDRAYETTHLDDQRCPAPVIDGKGKKPICKKPWVLGREEAKGKQRAVDAGEDKEKEKELSVIWNQIERAHGNGLREQVYVVDADRQALKEKQREETFYCHLVDHNSSGRLISQDHPLPSHTPSSQPGHISCTATATGVANIVDSDKGWHELLTLTDFFQHDGRRGSASTVAGTVGRENVDPTISSLTERATLPKVHGRVRIGLADAASSMENDTASTSHSRATGPSNTFKKLISGAGFVRRNSQPVGISSETHEREKEDVTGRIRGSPLGSENA